MYCHTPLVGWCAIMIDYLVTPIYNVDTQLLD